MPDGAPLTGLLVGFARALRAAGLTVGSGDAQVYCAAAAALDPADPGDLYWAGRATLVSRRDDIPCYDRVFRQYFLGEPPAADRPRAPRPGARSQGVLTVPDAEPDGDREDEPVPMGLAASGAEALRAKDFAACTPEELAALRRIVARLRLLPPRRRTRRTVPAGRGPHPDLRRTVRETLRTHGEPARLYRRDRRLRLRPLVLILDVSGSMAEYSRTLVQFGHSAGRAAPRVEVFCFGTRLTRVTRALARRRPDDALARAAREVLDWDGGTRIGDALTTFVRYWGHRGLCRGAIVVICSDGLDRGDPAVLSAALARLSRQCHRVLWVNPLARDGGPPATLAMTVAARHVDRVLPGHDLRSLAALATVLPEVSRS